MFTSKTTSRFICLSLTLLLLFTLVVKIKSSEQTQIENDDEELGDIEELIALDEEEDPQVRSSEAELLSKAQRIVAELSIDNYKRVIDENEYVMLLGYAPWCPRSAELMPQFAEAATSLKEMGSSLFMAKLDAERYPKAASALDIKGYPTLLLFTNGTSQAYTGGFLAEEIVIWARKKTGFPVIRVTSNKEAEELLKKYHMFVLGLFEKFEGQEYQEFYKAASTNNDIQFVETNDINVAKVLFPDVKHDKHFLGLVKGEPERYTTYEGSFDADNILHFLDHNKFPLVTKLTEINSVQVYSSPIKLQVLVFAKADDFEKLLEPLQDVARKFKPKIIFIYVDLKEENLARPFLTLYGLEESESTVVTAFDNEGNSKYLLESDLTPRNIEEFCLGLVRKSLSPYFKSQPIPEKNESAVVQTVVGKTFDDLVLNNPKNVLLEVHTPWCINCETTSKQVEKLAKHFKGLDELIFARIDASANEHPRLQIDDFPTLLFYPANDKSNPVKFPTKSSSKNLAEVINKQLKAKGQAIKDEL